MKKTVWLCRDRQGEKVFLERPSYNGMHDFFEGKQASFENVARSRKLYRVITSFVVRVQTMFGESKLIKYSHKRAGLRL